VQAMAHSAAADSSAPDWLDMLEDSSIFTFDGLECVICTEIMEDPVITADGHSYCRACILDWFRICDKKVKCPVLLAPATLLPLSSREVLPNTALRQAIESYSDMKPDLVLREQQIRLLQAQLDSAHTTIRELRAQVNSLEEEPAAAKPSVPHAKPSTSFSSPNSATDNGEDLEAREADSRPFRKPSREPPPKPKAVRATPVAEIEGPASSEKLPTPLLRSKPVTGREEFLDDDEAEQPDLDPPAKELATLPPSDNKFPGGNFVLALLKKEKKRKKKERKKQRIKEKCEEENFSSHFMYETFDDGFERQRTCDFGKSRLWSAVRQFMAGDYEETSFVRFWNAAQASEVDQASVMRQLVKLGFEVGAASIQGPPASRIFNALLTLLKNEAISWQMLECELAAGLFRSEKRARALGNFFCVPESYVGFISELLTTNFDRVSSSQGLLEPLFRVDDKEMALQMLLSVLQNVNASRGLPGLKVAMRQVESTAPNTNDEARDFFAKMF
jgi:hypothetical protein